MPRSECINISICKQVNCTCFSNPKYSNPVILSIFAAVSFNDNINKYVMSKCSVMLHRQSGGGGENRESGVQPNSLEDLYLDDRSAIF